MLTYILFATNISRLTKRNISIKGLPNASIKKLQKWAGIVVKTEKRSGAVRKDYH